MTIGSNGWNKLSGSSVPKREVELASRPCSDVITYRLSDEELERYRAMPRPGKAKAPTRPPESTFKPNEGENTMPRVATTTLTRSRFLEERCAGKTRAAIAKEYGLLPGNIYPLLDRWGLRDRDVEALEIAQMRSFIETLQISVQVEVTAEESIHNEVGEKPVTEREQVHQSTSKPPDSTAIVDEIYPGEDTLVHYVTLRIPIRDTSLPDGFDTREMDRAQTFSTVIKMIQATVAWTYKDIVELLGTDNVTDQVQRYVDRQVDKYSAMLP